jgi:hypothetical protein
MAVWEMHNKTIVAAGKCSARALGDYSRVYYRGPCSTEDKFMQSTDITYAEDNVESLFIKR